MERWVGGYKDGWIAEQPQHRAVSPCIVSPGQGTQGGAEWYSRASEGIVTGTEMTPGLSPRPGPPKAGTVDLRMKATASPSQSISQAHRNCFLLKVSSLLPFNLAPDPRSQG